MFYKVNMRHCINLDHVVEIMTTDKPAADGRYCRTFLMADGSRLQEFSVNPMDNDSLPRPMIAAQPGYFAISFIQDDEGLHVYRTPIIGWAWSEYGGYIEGVCLDSEEDTRTIVWPDGTVHAGWSTVFPNEASWLAEATQPVA
jgi:hypothetical protein